MKSLGREIDESLISARLGLAIDRDPSISVMVIEIVSESLASYFQAQMRSAALDSRSLGQRIHQSDQLRAPTGKLRTVGQFRSIVCATLRHPSPVTENQARLSSGVVSSERSGARPREYGT